MPTLQSADLWRQSGRYDAYGPEMLRIKDRHDREMLYGPTNEEMITDIFKDDVKSYRDLPRTLYHIQWKFRDEVRPRFGVMRGREFLMKDAYSFDLDEAGRAQQLLHPAARLSPHLPADGHPRGADEGGVAARSAATSATSSSSSPRPARAKSSTMPRSRSSTGRRPIFSYDDAAGLEALFDKVSSTYSATDETHDEARWAEVAADRRREGRGIEVGHIFYFGDKYSASMGLKVSGPDGSHGDARRWAATASACRAWSARSSRPAMTRPGSSGPKRSRRGRSGW